MRKSGAIHVVLLLQYYIKKEIKLALPGFKPGIALRKNQAPEYIPVLIKRS